MVLQVPNWAAKPCQEPLRSFLGSKLAIGGGLKRARYGVPQYETLLKRGGTCYAAQCSSPEEVLARARSLLDSQEATEKQASVFSPSVGTTCEDIAFWCKTGKRRWTQIGSAGPRSMRTAAARPSGPKEVDEMPSTAGHAMEDPKQTANSDHPDSFQE